MNKLLSEEKILHDVAYLYYEQQLTQSEIASKLGLSRVKISRLLKEARDKGIVKIIIYNPYNETAELEHQLLEQFSLTAAKVVSVSPTYDDLLLKQVTTQEAASFITRFLKNGETIGVSWGSTLYELVNAFPYIPMPNSTIIQLNGGIDNANSRNYASQIIQVLSHKFGSQAYTLPCPAIMGSSEIKEALLTDTRLSKLLELGKQADKAIVSVGVPGFNSCLVQSGYLSSFEMDMLKRKGAISDLCSRYFDIKGNICDGDLNSRTVGISLLDLSNIECVIGIATGENKGMALLGALRGGYIDILVTDSETASKALQLAKIY